MDNNYLQESRNLLLYGVKWFSYVDV